MEELMACTSYLVGQIGRGFLKIKTLEYTKKSSDASSRETQVFRCSLEIAASLM